MRVRGALGVTFAPGKQDPSSLGGAWARNLDLDLDAIAASGAKIVVTLIEDHEFALLRIPNLGAGVQRRGMEWLHLPIRDVDIPDANFEATWPGHSRALRDRLARDDNVIVHCRGGLGRAGMIAARLLVEAGLEPQTAIAEVRRVRPGAIETRAQANWVAEGAVSKNGDAAP